MLGKDQLIHKSSCVYKCIYPCIKICLCWGARSLVWLKESWIVVWLYLPGCTIWSVIGFIYIQIWNLLDKSFVKCVARKCYLSACVRVSLSSWTGDGKADHLSCHLICFKVRLWSYESSISTIWLIESSITQLHHLKLVIFGLNLIAMVGMWYIQKIEPSPVIFTFYIKLIERL